MAMCACLLSFYNDILKRRVRFVDNQIYFLYVYYEKNSIIIIKDEVESPDLNYWTVFNVLNVFS